MKKTLAALALAMALLTVPAAAFSDVDEGVYYAAPIAWAVEQGITTGTTGDTFSPDTLCTRGQIITFLWRAAGSPAPEAGASPFADVTEDLNPSFYKAILWAYQAGITGEEPEFHPSAPCDRGTTMYFLWRCAGSPAASAPGSFTDVAPDAGYVQAVAWAVEAGITEGTAETTFSPSEPCTRGQIATFLYRCLNKQVPETPEEPEEPAVPAPVPVREPENIRPMRVLSGQGKAHSLGLDGSEFTIEEVYEAEATVKIYSPCDAVFTVEVPFPLYQACSYTVRFDDPENPEASFLFTCIRWDEAFTDVIPWEGEPYEYRFSSTSGSEPDTATIARREEEDRIGGMVSWRVSFKEGGSFHYDMLDGYQLSCEVNSNL